MRSAQATPMKWRCAVVGVLLAGLSLSALATDRPSWIEQPNRQGYFGIVGSATTAENGSAQTQRKLGTLRARQEAGRVQRVVINAEVQQQAEESRRQGANIGSSAAQMSSNVVLDLSRMQLSEEWIDPKSGELFLLFLIPVDP